MNDRPPVKRVTVPKASDLLANQLRAQILAAEWPEGSLLPTERELVVRAGLSRASVREALRRLELEGLIMVKHGRGGGSTVRRPTRDILERSVAMFIQGRHLRPSVLMETREALEVLLVGMAARNRTDEDRAILEALHAKLMAARTDHPAFVQANIAWHLAVVDASHNELLIAIVHAISHEIFRHTLMDEFGSEDVRTATLRSHARIMDAIIKGDAAAAQRRMARHISAYIEMARGSHVSLQGERSLFGLHLAQALGEMV
jgi:GntR family transcriptional repressor for pyruvate dehydrogenase complex